MTLSYRRRRRTRNVLIFALAVSVFIHLTGIGIWDWLARELDRFTPKPTFLGSLREPPAPKIDIIRLEERPAPARSRPAHEDHAAKVAPHPHPVATVAPAPAKPRHEIARIRPRAAPQAPVPQAKSVLAISPRHAKTVVMAPVPNNQPALSDRQIEQLGRQFSKTIAESRETLAGVQAALEAAPVTTVKHYTMHFNGIHEGMNPGDGDIYVISRQRIGDTMWYYTRYVYMYGDGTVESDDIPWPFHYAIGDDPFARHDKRVPIQPPPAGYKPDRPLKPILQQYFGGPPVG